VTITRQKIVCLFWSTLNRDRFVDIIGLGGKRNQETFGEERHLPKSSRKWRSRQRLCLRESIPGVHRPIDEIRPLHVLTVVSQ
jgi:hypothetical protein